MASEIRQWKVSAFLMVIFIPLLDIVSDFQRIFFNITGIDRFFGELGCWNFLPKEPSKVHSVKLLNPQNVRFQNVLLQKVRNVRFTKCSIFKTSGFKTSVYKASLQVNVIYLFLFFFNFAKSQKTFSLGGIRGSRFQILSRHVSLARKRLKSEVICCSV